MPVPEFVVRRRDRIGHGLLPLVGAVGVVIEDDRVLVHRRADTGSWWLPGGIVEPGEQPALAVVREVFEETGLHVEVERLTSVEARDPYTFPNGDQVQFLDMTFRCRMIGGQLRTTPDGESLDVQWFELERARAWHPRICWWIDRALGIRASVGGSTARLRKVRRGSRRRTS